MICTQKKIDMKTEVVRTSKVYNISSLVITLVFSKSLLNPFNQK